MRDIREDLQERINFLSNQMSSARAEFDREVEQIEKEHESKLKGLKANLEAVNRLIGAEAKRLGNTPDVPKAQPQPQASKAEQPKPPKARPRIPLADLIGLQRAS
jgi:hypothetical protein